MTAYRAVQNQNLGKFHRATSRGLTTLCGMTITGAWSWLPDAETLPEDRCRRCWRVTPTVVGRPHRHAGGPLVTFADGHRCTSHDYEPADEPTATDVRDALIDTEVARAVDCYRHHMPGHGEYILVRLGMKLERLEETVAEARDVLAEQ